jgi:hypothetical protein
METSKLEPLKADLPLSKWGKILGATPIIMTVVATMLAGLSSSEMTRAQYERSLAAQLQSKAGDQWNFFQAKRLRSTLQQSTLDLMVSGAAPNRLDGAALGAALLGTPEAAMLDSPAGRQALAALTGRELPTPAAARPLDENVHQAHVALETFRPDAEFAGLLAKVNDDVLENAVREARDGTVALDAALKPISQVVDSIEHQLERPETDASLRRNFIAARVAFNARRYEAEARLNQAIAGLYELQVRKSNLSAERHHRRSQKFFYGMLAAQMGVIISTFSIAARKRNLLWSLAAAAGTAAIAFAVYVYLYV